MQVQISLSVARPGSPPLHMKIFFILVFCFLLVSGNQSSWDERSALQGTETDLLPSVSVYGSGSEKIIERSTNVNLWMQITKIVLGALTLIGFTQTSCPKSGDQRIMSDILFFTAFFGIVEFFAGVVRTAVQFPKLNVPIHFCSSDDRLKRLFLYFMLPVVDIILGMTKATAANYWHIHNNGSLCIPKDTPDTAFPVPYTIIFVVALLQAFGLISLISEVGFKNYC